MICTECEKEYEHDLYHFWCNECGKQIEQDMINRLKEEPQ